jgi:hypothetical protein
MAELTVPQIDFSSLGQLPAIYKQGQADNLRQQTLANLGQGGAVDANTLLKSGDLSLAQLGISLRNRQEDQARQATQDEEHKREFGMNYDIQKKRLANELDPTPDNFIKDQNAPGGYRPIGPATPEYKASIAKAEADAGTSKPIPVETIGGTKFLMRNKDGGYSLVDPTSLGAPAQPQQVPQTAPNVAQATPPQGGSDVVPPVQPVQPAQPVQQPDPDTVDPKTGRREGYLQSLDPGVRDYIKKVADYEIDPRTTSVKGGMREKLMSAVAKYDPAYNQNEFGTRAKAMKDFSTGTQGNIIRSFDVAIDHLDTLQKAATAMQNGDTRLINSIRNKWREETGSDLPTNFQSLVPLVSGEIAKAVIGSNNALSDREELRNLLKAANSPGQISGTIQSYKALMSGQLKGLKKQYEQTTGKKDFDSRIRDATRNELESGTKAAPVTVDGYTITEH